MWPALASFPDPKIPIQTCLIISTNEHRFACSLIYGDRYFVYKQINPFLRTNYMKMFEVLTTYNYHILPLLCILMYCCTWLVSGWVGWWVGRCVWMVRRVGGLVGGVKA